MTLSRRLAPLLLIALAALALAPPAGAAKKSIWGPVRLPDGASAFPQYRELGVDIFQIQLSWIDTAPERPADPRNPDDPAYRWPARIDEVIAAGREEGIEIALMIKGRGTPGWANEGREPTWAATDPGDLADFATAASRRYPAVRFWMVWGEVTQLNNYSPMPADSPVGPRSYARMLDATYAALHAVRRRNRVIGGMTHSAGTVRPAQFIRWMRLPDGRPPRMDFYGHNPLSYRYPAANRRYPQKPNMRDLGDLRRLNADLRRAYRKRGRTPKLWLSEYTISSDRPNRAFSFAVSRTQQARWLTSAYRIADRDSSVYTLGWFALLDDPVTTPEAITTGLMTYEGERKPAWWAFVRAPSARDAPRIVSYPRSAGRRTLAGRGVAVRMRTRTPGTHSVQLRRGGRIVAVRRTRSRRTVRLRLRSRSARRGTYTLRFVSPRGQTLTRRVRIR